MTRALRLSPDLLLLTAPDPGPRPNGFLRRGKLVTATCGSAAKYASNYAFGYAETVAVILTTTGGWHVHIGPLPGAALAEIAAAMRRAGVAENRFVHLPWVPSLAEALWEHQCDVYIASFPTDGARAYVEVAAAGVPYVAHSSLPRRSRRPWAIGPNCAAQWGTWHELATALQSMSDVAVLEENARRIRNTYERLHHPDVFRQSLMRIVAGGGGIADPEEVERDQAVFRSLIGSLTTAIIAHRENSDQRLDEMAAEGQAQRREVEQAVTLARLLMGAPQGAIVATEGRSDRRLGQIGSAGQARGQELAELRSLIESLQEALVAMGQTTDRRLEQIATDIATERREREDSTRQMLATIRSIRSQIAAGETRRKAGQARMGKQLQRLSAEVKTLKAGRRRRWLFFSWRARR